MSRTPGVVARIKIIIIVMYIYDALINGLRAHIIHINLSTIFYTHVEDSPTKAIYIRHYMDTHTHRHAHTHAHTHAFLQQLLCVDISWGRNTVRRGRFSVWL